MQTVFSHIVQKRFSQVNEDVATDALAFILRSSASARAGMMKLLRGLVPDLPELEFRTQQTEGSIRPDMWGLAGMEPRVYIENKFWAGLTDKQPVCYLGQLARCPQPTILLAIVPEAREESVWREFCRRLASAGLSSAESIAPAGIVHACTVGDGQTLALTSWNKVLSTLELEVADDPGARSDLAQLRALCEAADSEAFIPMSAAELTDQRAPALILQAGNIAQGAVSLGVSERLLSVSGLKTGHSWGHMGRYARFAQGDSPGFWLGVHLGLWRKHGITPLWLTFSTSAYGRANEARAALEPWASRQGLFTAWEPDGLAVAMEIEPGEDRDRVIRDIVDRLRDMAQVLSATVPDEEGAP